MKTSMKRPTKNPMQSIIRVLAIVAVVQIALVAVAYMGGNELQASQSKAVLLSFQPDSVDSVTLYGADKQAVKLHKDKGWKTDGGFPADAGKIDLILQRLSGLKHGLAVATSPSSWPRFKLGKGDFERHLILSKGDKVVAELYLGKGAGARQSYARNSHDQAAYSVALGSYDMPLDESQWQDKTLLQITADQVSELDIADMKLVKTSGVQNGGDNKDSSVKQVESFWHADSTPAGKQLDQHAVQQALHLLATLRFEKVLGKQPPDGFDLAHPILTVAVHRQKKLRQYRFAKANSGDKYLLKVSDHPEYFAVSSYTLKEWRKQMNKGIWFINAPVSPPGSTGQVEKSNIPPSIIRPDDKEAEKFSNGKKGLVTPSIR